MTTQATTEEVHVLATIEHVLAAGHLTRVAPLAATSLAFAACEVAPDGTEGYPEDITAPADPAQAIAAILELIKAGLDNAPDLKAWLRLDRCRLTLEEAASELQAATRRAP